MGTLLKLRTSAIVRLAAFMSLITFGPACVGTAAPGRSASNTPDQKLATPSVSLSSSAPAPPVADGTPERPFDVIIVGAGMAGLTAAKVFKRAGRSFAVIEAQNRIGGRAWVDNDFSTPIDLGGAWIHEISTNPLTPLILGSGRQVVATDVDATHHIHLKGRFAGEEERALFACIQKTFENNLEDAAHPDTRGKPPEQIGTFVPKGSARDHLPTEKKECEAEQKAVKKITGAATFAELLRLVELNAGPLESAVELENNSVADAADFQAGDDRLIVGGFGGFVADYGREILPDVRLNSKVVEILHDQSPPAVKIEGQGLLHARKILVTVSTGVLAKKVITFKPGLDAEKEMAINSIRMGVLNKVIFELDPAKDKTFHYPVDGTIDVANRWVLYGGDLSTSEDDIAFVFRPANKNIVIGFAGGRRAEKFEKENNKEFIDLAKKAFNDMCKCKIDEVITRVVTTKWASSEISYGAYSAAAPTADGIDYRAVLGRPVGENLYFAGEACYNTQFNGSFAAAYNSGLLNAQRIQESLCAAGIPAKNSAVPSCGVVSPPAAK